MTLLLPEIKERLAILCDPCLLCDLLDIETEELLENFEDKLLDRLDLIEDVFSIGCYDNDPMD